MPRPAGTTTASPAYCSSSCLGRLRGRAWAIKTQWHASPTAGAACSGAPTALKRTLAIPDLSSPTATSASSARRSWRQARHTQSLAPPRLRPNVTSQKLKEVTPDSLALATAATPSTALMTRSLTLGRCAIPRRRQGTVQRAGFGAGHRRHQLKAAAARVLRRPAQDSAVRRWGDIGRGGVGRYRARACSRRSLSLHPPHQMCRNLVLGFGMTHDYFGWKEKHVSLFSPRVLRGFVHPGKIPAHSRGCKNRVRQWKSATAPTEMSPDRLRAGGTGRLRATEHAGFSFAIRGESGRPQLRTLASAPPQGRRGSLVRVDSAHTRGNPAK